MAIDARVQKAIDLLVDSPLNVYIPEGQSSILVDLVENSVGVPFVVRLSPNGETPLSYLINTETPCSHKFLSWTSDAQFASGSFTRGLMVEMYQRRSYIPAGTLLTRVSAEDYQEALSRSAGVSSPLAR